MEFHEFKSRHWTTPCVELYCHVSDLPTFLSLCVGKEEWSKKYGTQETFDYEMIRIKKSQAIWQRTFATEQKNMESTAKSLIVRKT